MLCEFGSKHGKDLVSLSFVPVIKPNTHKVYILRHRNNRKSPLTNNTNKEKQ